MEQLHPEANLTPVNAIEIKMPDGSSLEVHAPGAPDVLAAPSYNSIAEVGDPLEPLFSDTRLEDSNETAAPHSVDSDNFLESDKTVDFSEFYTSPDEKEMVLASGLAVNGIGKTIRGWRARRHEKRAQNLESLAKDLDDYADDEWSYIVHRSDTAMSKGALARTTKPKIEPIFDADGNPVKISSEGDLSPVVVGEQTVAEQAFGATVKSFQKTHMTRKLFFNGEGQPITKEQHEARKPFVMELARIDAEIVNIKLKYEGVRMPEEIEARLEELVKDKKSLEVVLKDPTVKNGMNNGSRTRAEGGTIISKSIDLADYAARQGSLDIDKNERTARDPRMRKDSEKIAHMRAEIAELQSEINSIRYLYGDEEMPASTARKLEALEHHQSEIVSKIREMSEARDPQSENEKATIRNNKEYASKLREKATKKRNKAARLRSRDLVK